MMPPHTLAASHKRHGFTLIELLVVIAVIGVLLGILLPTLAASRKRARDVVCMSQARQIMTAMNAFVASNKGRLPENRPLINDGEHITWRYLFLRNGYIGQDQAWICPSHPGQPPAGEQGMIDNGTRCAGDIPSSFAINGHVVWRERKRTDEADQADTAIARPSHTLLLAETAAAFPDIRVINRIVASEFGPDGGGAFGYWHQFRGTYAFMDGHAEQLGFLSTGNPDCRWHNGRDLTPDPINPQPNAEIGPHAHPDWELLVPKMYLKAR
ncbi:MAG: type II secretion system GspH family protein [Phycisphaerales bacterium]|nr:type II secretion system GspH family protein [Phycisphaerales bacterium]